MVIGGIANLIWGSPRTTLDIDVTVQIPDVNRSDFIDALAQMFTVLPQDPLSFVRDTRVLPLSSSEGIRIDVMFALLPYEEQALRRAIRKTLGDVEFQVCSAEDLIIHKIISDRPQDKADVIAVIGRQKRSLDRSYLDPIIAALAQQLDKSEILEAYKLAMH
jgi:hypothetical protein